MKIINKPFGLLPSGKTAYLYTISNSNGMEVSITNYGGIVTSINVPDGKGKTYDAVMGFDTLDEYLADNSYFGCIAGRYANRIANGRFTLNKKEYKLTINRGEHHLHGGVLGFNRQIWETEKFENNDEAGIKLSYISKAGEEGFPGSLSVSVCYVLGQENALSIHYVAETDKATIINLTNHSYFNIGDSETPDILGQTLQINADSFVIAGKDLIPTGEIRKVEGTPFDFRNPIVIGKRLNEPYEQIVLAGGYDATFVLNSPGTLKGPSAVLCDDATERMMEVYTTEPGLQLYTGNFLKGDKGKGGRIYSKHSGLCLEAQHFPDSPNHPNFPTTTLLPDQQYSQTTIYKFSVK